MSLTNTINTPMMSRIFRIAVFLSIATALVSTLTAQLGLPVIAWTLIYLSLMGFLLILAIATIIGIGWILDALDERRGTRAADALENGAPR